MPDIIKTPFSFVIGIEILSTIEFRGRGIKKSKRKQQQIIS
jgi:hypothetical protein